MQSLSPTEPEPRLDPNSRGEGGCGSGSGTRPHLRPPGLTRRWLSGDLVRLAGQAGHALVCRVTSPCAGSGCLWPPVRSLTPDSPLFSLPGTCHRYADISAPQLLLCKGRGRPGPGCGDVCLPHASESLSRRGLAPCQARGAHAADICRKIGKGEGEPGPDIMSRTDGGCATSGATPAVALLLLRPRHSGSGCLRPESQTVTDSGCLIHASGEPETDSASVSRTISVERR